MAVTMEISDRARALSPGGDQHIAAATASSVELSNGTALMRTQASAFDDLVQFKRWGVFLPTATSSEVDRNAVYIRARHTGNPKFFDHMRDKLARVLRDRELLNNTGAAEGDGGGGVAAVLELVMQAQWTAFGFVCDRQFHKALSLGDLCVAIVDALAAEGTVNRLSGDDNFCLFFQLLCRANLGGALGRFAKYEEASKVLKQGMKLTDSGSASLGARERVMLATLYAHLSRVYLDMGDVTEAARLAELEIDIFERFIWELSDAKDDREAQSLVLATSYVTRGVCDVHKRKFDTGLMWFGRAQECIEKYVDLGVDSDQLLEKIRAHADHARTLQLQ